MQTLRVRVLSSSSDVALRRVAAVVAGALFVGLAAQAAVSLPGTPVPLTFQVPAVLIVGALLGPRLGAASLVLYLTMGAAGLPVFAPIGAPGVARLVGPTGGYLLATPVAAALVGRMTGHGGGRPARIAVAMVLGMAVMHLGGIAQLALLGGDVSTALRLGSLPFLVGDGVKLLFAGLIIGKFGSRFRALL